MAIVVVIASYEILVDLIVAASIGFILLSIKIATREVPGGQGQYYQNRQLSLDRRDGSGTDNNHSLAGSAGKDIC
jgi:hypothetical protein